MKIKFRNDFHHRDGDFHIRYIASLSDGARALKSVLAGPMLEKFCKVIEDTIQAFDEDEPLKASLQIKPFGVKGFMTRQCDIRTSPDGPIFIKTFVSWSSEHNCWHIFAELPSEDWVEEKP
jgi:hypothetical protein